MGRREQLLLLGGAATAAVVAAGAGAPAPACAAQAQAEACSEFSTAATNGLQWCETLVGDGPAPVAGAMIRCHYTGRLQTNGAVFDSSYERGRPLEFKIGVRQVIVGWDLGILGDEAQGIPAMLEGGKRRLVIPADLAYGKRTMGPIPPDSTLVRARPPAARVGLPGKAGVSLLTALLPCPPGV